MKKIILLFLCCALSANAQLLRYSFENTDSATVNHTQGLASHIVKTGLLPLASYFSGNPATGYAISFHGWKSNGSTDPDTSAATYLEFGLDSRGFDSLSLSADFRVSNTTLHSIRLLWSVDNGNHWHTGGGSNSLGTTFASVVWNLASDSGINNNRYVKFRLYAWGDTSLSSLTNLRMDNLSVFGTAISLLPVTLIDFRARYSGDAVVLSWRTASEINNDRFEVEYSQNGIQFEKIGEAKGHCNSNTEEKYHFIVPVPLPAGMAYFRLRQVDFNGESQLSSIIALCPRSDPLLEVRFHRGEILFSEEVASLTIYSMSGCALCMGQHVRQLSVATLPRGLYILEAQCQGKVTKQVFGIY